MPNTFNGEQKAKVALAAVKGLKTINEIAQEYGVHPTQVTLWKKELLANAGSLLDSKQCQLVGVTRSVLYEQKNRRLEKPAGTGSSGESDTASVWMEGVARWITFLSNDCGAA